MSKPELAKPGGRPTYGTSQSLSHVPSGWWRLQLGNVQYGCPAILIAPGKGGLLVSMAKQPGMSNVAARIATFRICICYHERAMLAG